MFIQCPTQYFFTSELFAAFHSDWPWELEFISILNVEFQTKEGRKFREMIKALTWPSWFGFVLRTCANCPNESNLEFLRRHLTDHYGPSPFYVIFL